MAYKKIGIITKVHGFRGELLVEEIFSFEKFFIKNQKVLIGFSEKFAREYTLTHWKTNKRATLVSLEEIHDDKSALHLKEQGIFIDESQLLVKQIEDDIFEDEVIGCRVIDLSNNEDIGRVAEVLYLPGNDVWEIETKRGMLPVPVIDDCIISVDLIKREIKINILDGLWELLDEEKE